MLIYLHRIAMIRRLVGGTSGRAVDSLWAIVAGGSSSSAPRALGGILASCSSPVDPRPAFAAGYAKKPRGEENEPVVMVDPKQLKANEQAKVQKALDALRHQLGAIRSRTASPALLESIRHVRAVPYHGAPSAAHPAKQIIDVGSSSPTARRQP